MNLKVNLNFLKVCSHALFFTYLKWKFIWTTYSSSEYYNYLLFTKTEKCWALYTYGQWRWILIRNYIPVCPQMSFSDRLTPIVLYTSQINLVPEEYYNCLQKKEALYIGFYSTAHTYRQIGNVLPNQKGSHGRCSRM